MTYPITWETDFTPIRLELVERGNYEVLETKTAGLNMNGSWNVSASYGGKAAYLRAYYGDEMCRSSSDFVIGPASHTFITTPTTGALIPSNQTYPITWETSFTPIRIQLVEYETGTVLATRINTLRPSMTWEVPAAFGGKTVRLWAYYGADQCTISYSFTLVPQAHTITFDPHGGVLEETTAQTGVDGTLAALPVPTRENYRFISWLYNDLGGVQRVASDQTVYYKPTTLTARWVPIPHTVTVVNGTCDRSTVGFGETVQITAQARQYGIFAMWVVDSGHVSLADPLSPVTTFTMETGDVVVRALYTHELTLDANGGTVDPASVRTDPGGMVHDGLPRPVREGYNFLFWTYESGLQWKIVTSSTVFERDTALRAEWAGISHSITVQDGTASLSSAVPERTVTITAREQESYTFDHWEVLGGGVTLADADSAVTTFTMGIQPVTVRAYYVYSGAFIPEVRLYVAEPEAGQTPAAPAVNSGDYSVNNWQWFDVETGTALAAEDTFVRGKAYRLTVYCRTTGIDPVFDANTAACVNDSQDGVAFTYQFSAQVQVDRIFEVADFTVAFDANGGAGTMAPAEHVGLNYTLPACGFVPPENYIFGGWDLGQPGDVIAVTDDLTLTAQWRPIAGTCGASVTWSLDPVSGVLTISGTGDMADYSTTGPSPFADDERIRSVVVENGITAVGTRMFSGCVNLQSVSLPGTLTHIHVLPFMNCTSLTDIALPASVKYLSANLFYNCTSLREITIPAGVTSIPMRAFHGCASLTSVTVLSFSALPGTDIFRGLSPDKVTVYGWEGSTMDTWCAENGFPFVGMPVGGACGDDTAWSLNPATGVVTVSGTGPMWDYDLGSSPIYGQRYVTSAVIDSGVTHVGGGFFAGCGRMTGVSLPATLTSIGEEAFASTGLTSISLRGGVTVGERAFSGCEGLTAVTIPAGTAAVAPGMFAGCSNLTSVSLPAGLQTIGAAAFLGTGLTDITLPDSLTTIGAEAFGECQRLTVVVIPGRVTALPDRLFRFCTELTTVVLPDSVASIGELAFAGCSGLTSFEIPWTVTSVGNYAFADCSALTDVTILNPDTVLSGGTFAEQNMALVVHGWGDTQAQTCCESAGVTYDAWPRAGRCGENVTWALDPLTGTVTLSGTGPMYAYNNTDNKSPFNGYGKVRSLVAGEGVTGIGNYAFYGCPALTEIDLGQVSTVGIYAFYGCTSLLSVDLPQSVSLVGACAFEKCSQLRTVTVRNDSITLYDAIFYSCPWLTLYGHVNSGAEAYAARNRISYYPMDFEPSFFLPAGLTAVEDGAFEGIPAIAVVFPNPDTSIWSGAFDGSSVKYFYAFAGSEAQSYAAQYGIFFVPIDAEWLASH